jgi:hypothetical protein
MRITLKNGAVLSAYLDEIEGSYWNSPLPSIKLTLPSSALRAASGEMRADPEAPRAAAFKRRGGERRAKD